VETIEYSKSVLKHFKHPKNMGKMKLPDAVGQAGNTICGDTMEISIKVKDNKIKDIKFQTLGCAAAIAISSVLTELAKGKTLEQAEKINSEDIVKALGGLPQPKVHCSLLAKQALNDAIKKYKNKK
jgi:NifU-like protein involved in Fe-S cluster formation